MKRRYVMTLKKITAVILSAAMLMGNASSAMAVQADDVAVQSSAEERAKSAPAAEAPPPATEAPSTEAPTTEAPTTEAPATEEPATEAPSTEAPATEAPATEAPSTEAPATEAPTTEAPSADAPSTDAPAAEAPATDAPATDASTAKPPAIENGIMRVEETAGGETGDTGESDSSEPVRVTLSLTAVEGEDAKANREEDKLIFTATAFAELASGEELPEGADYVYTYQWQYAQRQYSWWGQEQSIAERDWKDCITGNEKEKLEDGSYNPFYGSETEGQGSVGKLTLALPDGVDRRDLLSDLTVRCVVSAQVKDSEKEYSDKVSATTGRMNIEIADALLCCNLTAVVDGTNVSISNSGDTLTWSVKPILENGPKDEAVTYSYEWQYYNEDKGTWYSYNYAGSRRIPASPIKTATVNNLGEQGCILSYPLPALVSTRETLQGLKVRCKITASGSGDYTINGSPMTISQNSSPALPAVTIADHLLTYTLEVQSSSSAAITADENGAPVEENLSFTVTAALDGAESSFRNYTYEWQYLKDGEWAVIGRDDADCPLRYAAGIGSSVLTMALPENVESRKMLNGTQVRCVVRANPGQGKALEKAGETATISIDSALLSEFHLKVTEDASNCSSVGYPGQVLCWRYPAVVTGINAEEAVLVYKWEFKGRDSAEYVDLETVDPAGQYVTDEAGNRMGFVVSDTTDKELLKTLSGGSVRCTVELYANADERDNGSPCEVRKTIEKTITVDDKLVADYQESWLKDAWLDVDIAYDSPILSRASDEAFMGIEVSVGEEIDYTNIDPSAKDNYHAAYDRSYNGGMKHLWEYREGDSQEWRSIELLDRDVRNAIKVEYGEGDYVHTSNIVISLPETYAARIRLSGMQFRCTSVAMINAEEPGKSTPFGVVAGSTESVLTVVVNPKLLHSQASSTRRIVSYLTKEAADQYLIDAAPGGILDGADANTLDAYAKSAQKYDAEKSYEVEYFEDGVREEVGTADFPDSVVAVYEYQVEKDIETVETKQALVEIPVPWKFIVQNGKQYDYAASKAQYRYDAIFMEIIPQWNAEELQKYIDTHDPNAIDYDEGDAVKWVMAAGLNGRSPHIKVCWNTELMGLANHADYVKYNGLYGSTGSQEEKDKVAALAGSSVNPYWLHTYSDWFFKDASELGYTPSSAQKAEASNAASAEAEQLAWLNSHYPTVKVMMEDVRSDETDPTPIVMELPVTWKKNTIYEYDPASQSMSACWMGDQAISIMQGTDAAAAKWGWQATIDAIEEGEYVTSGTLRYVPIEANIYWSRVVDAIVGALVNNQLVSVIDLSNAGQFSSKIPQELRVELKDANGGVNILESIPVNSESWKLIEGSVYESSYNSNEGTALNYPNHWRHLSAEAESVAGEVGTTASAGFLAIEPTLEGYTFTQNADTEQARVWYQWGTIITELKKADGTDLDAVAVAKTPLMKYNISGGSQSVVAWNNLVNSTAYLDKTFNLTAQDKKSSTGYKTVAVKPVWEKPSTHVDTAEAGMSQPAAQFENPGSGVVFHEDLVNGLRGRVPYAEISWKINPASSNFNNGKVASTLVGGRVKVNGVLSNGTLTKVAYSDAAWDMVASVLTSPSASPSSGQVGLSFPGYDTFYNVRDGVQFKLSAKPAGGGSYVQYDVTAKNTSNADRWVGFAMGADVMIHASDNATIEFTNDGFRMREVTGDYCEFRILLNSAVAGINISAEHRWAGKYHSRESYYWSGGKAGTGAAGSFGGVDSELTFSWLPKNHKLGPGETVTFTSMFGLGQVSDPPVLRSDSTARVNASDPTKIDVNAYMAGPSPFNLQLYYRFDEGLPTEMNEISLGSPQAGTGLSSYKNVMGQIEKPRNWVAGEYHSVTLYVVNSAGAMSGSKVFPLYVEEDENGNEIITVATEATVSFQKGSCAGGSIGGTVPAQQSAHIKEPILLPKGTTMTPPSGYKFVGWDYVRQVTVTNEDGTHSTVNETVTYPAESYFYIEHENTTLTAKWIPTSQTMYLVERYVQDADGNYNQENTEVKIDAGTGNITYTPTPRKGYTVNTGKSVLSVSRADNAVIKVYFDINKYPVKYHLNGAPGGDENGIFKTVQVAYGSNVSGVPNAAALNAGQSNNFFRFMGWYDTPDTDLATGNPIDTDTIVNEDTLDTTEPNGQLIAYARWKPTGSARITFDYNYVNHSQGATRSETRTLTPIYNADGSGRYSYSSAPASVPSRPSSWKDTAGKVYTFQEWRLVENGEVTDTVVTADTILPNYEDYTVKAVWTESYSVSRSTQGDGRVWDINDTGTIEKTYAPGDTVDIMWRANPGSYVQHVYIDNVLRDELIKTGGWHYENINENHSVYVIFGVGDGESDLIEHTTYPITATPVGGVAFTEPNRGGTYQAEFGEDYTVKWNISDGYTLSEITINGLAMDITDIDGEYQFNNIHTAQEIRVVAKRTDGSFSGGMADLNRGPYTLDTKIAKGTSITPSHKVPYLGSSTVTWKVPYGFVVDKVLVNRVALSQVPEDNSYTFNRMSANSSVIVMCVPDPNLPDDSIYVATTIDAHGTITPTTPIGQLSKGDNHTVTWSVDNGYHVSAVYINGQKQDGIFYSKTFTNLQSSQEVVVEVEADAPSVTTHTISTSITNGTIDKPGSVAAGSNVTVNWTVAANYRVKAVYLDGVAADGYTVGTSANTYTISNVQAAHSLKVECERIPTESVEDKYCVETRINLGTADGFVFVEKNAPCTVHWQPPTGYHVSQLKVDGTAQNNVTGNSWTIDSVTHNMVVEVTVAKDEASPTWQLTTDIVNGGTVSAGGSYAVGMGTTVNWTVADGFHVADVTIDGASISDLDLENDRSYTVPSGTDGQTVALQVICAPKLYYHVRPTSVGAVELSPSADPYLGESYTVSWKPAGNYRQASVEVNGSAVTPAYEESTGTYSYTFDETNTAANATYNVNVVCEKIPSYTITTSRNSGGTVSASKTIYQSDEEQTYQVHWNANTGYRAKAVTVTNADDPEDVQVLDQAQIAGGSFEFRYDAGKNLKLYVEFEQQKYYKVAATGQNTVVTPANGTYTVDTPSSVSWTSPEGFHLAGITLNGEVVAITEGQTSYAFDPADVAADETYNLHVIYEADAEETEEPEEFYAVQTTGIFTKQITPGQEEISLGENYTVEWIPADGYTFQTLTVDGTAIDPSADANYSYDSSTGVHSYVVSGNDRVDGDVVKVKVTCTRDGGSGTPVSKTYSVYATSNDAALGSVTPSAATLRNAGETSVIRWTAKPGCHVESITVSEYPDRANAQTLSAEETEYTFRYDENKNRYVDVVFARDPAYTVITAMTGETEGCSVTPTDPVTLTAEGSTQNVVWTAGVGYHAANVKVTDTDTGEVLQEYDEAALAGVTNYTFCYDDGKNQTVTVQFAKNPMFVISTEMIGGGLSTISGGGTLTAEAPALTVTWTPSGNYQVKSVTLTNLDNNSKRTLTADTDYTGNKYTFNFAELLAEDPNGGARKITVEFENKTSGGTGAVYSVNTSVNDSTMGTITPSVELTAENQIQVIEWTANAGFFVKSVTIDGTIYTKEANNLPENFTFAYSGHRDSTVDVEFAAMPKFTVQIAKAGNGGANSSVNVGTAQLETSGDTHMAIWSAGNGYRVESAVITDETGAQLKSFTAAEIAGNSYVFDYDALLAADVDGGERTLTITFGKISGGTSEVVHSVTTSVNDAAMGSVSPSMDLRTAGATYLVNWTAAEGYDVESVTIDGISYHKGDADFPADFLFKYDDGLDRTVNVEFQALPAYEIKTVKVGGGAGSTVRTGTTLAHAGETYPVNWTADSGFKVTGVTISYTNGDPDTILTAEQIAEKKYTFKYDEMSSDATLTVTFAEETGEEPVPTYPSYTVTAKVAEDCEAMGAVTPAWKTLDRPYRTADVVWSANAGYHAVKVTVTDTDSNEILQEYDESELTGMTAYTFHYDDEKNQTVVVEFAEDPSFEIVSAKETGSEGSENCTVSAGGILAAAGENLMVTWSAGSGERVKAVVIRDTTDPENVSDVKTLTAEEAAAGSYTFDYDSLLTQFAAGTELTISVSFENDDSGETGDPTYTVTTGHNGEEKGTVSASRTLSHAGETYLVTWNAKPGYFVKNVTLDGADYRDEAGQIPADYTFRYDEQQDRTVQVTFEAYPQYLIETEKIGGGEASIVREGSTLSRPGESYAVSWTAADGYKVNSVVITDADGSEIKTLDAEEIAANLYTFRYDEMNGNQKITVNFGTDLSGGGSGGNLPYSVITEVNDSAMGTIDPSQTLRVPGDSYEVTWRPKAGYLVKSVTIDGMEYTGEAIPESYVFRYDYEKDVLVHVDFEAVPQRTVTTVKQGNGGDSSTVSQGATLTASGQQHTVTWSAGEGFVVRSVVIVDTVGGTNRVSLNETEMALGSYTFAYDSMDRDRKITVIFAKEEGTTPGGGEDIPATPYTVTTEINDSTMGTVSPTKTLNTAGAEYDVLWSANPGYVVKSVTVGGRAYIGGSYTFKYDDHKDIVVKVTFAPKPQYAITTAIVDGGALSTISEGAVLDTAGQTHTVTWQAGEGYTVKSGEVSNAKGVVVYYLQPEELAAGAYTFGFDTMSSDQKLTITCKKTEGAGATPYTVYTSVNDSTMGTISPTKTLNAADAVYNVTWSANDGYRVKKVTIIKQNSGTNDDPAEIEVTEDQLANRTFVFAYNDLDDYQVTVDFEPVPAYHVTAVRAGSYGANCSAAPADTVLNPGESGTVTWQADTGYAVKSVVITDAEGNVKETLDETQRAAGAYTFAYDEMNSDETITVTFAKDTNPGGVVLPTYYISASAEGRGTVTPAGTTALNTDHAQQLITWSAEAGWHVENVTVNGEDYANADGSIPDSYLFEYDNHEDVALEVTFAENEQREIITEQTGNYGLSTISDGAVLNIPGSTYEVLWTVDEGYEIQSVTITYEDGSEVVLGESDYSYDEGTKTYSYTFAYDDNLQISQTITVDYAKKSEGGDAPDAYTLIVNANDDTLGEFTGSNVTVQSTDDSSYPVTWKAKDGYHVESVSYTIDGVPVEEADLPADFVRANVTDGTWSYTFSYSVVHDVTIDVEFAANEAYTVSVVTEGNGTAGDPKVLRVTGEEHTVTWTPGADAMLDYIAISGYPPVNAGEDGEVVISADQLEGSSYTFNYDEMDGDVTIRVVFKDPDYYYVTASGVNAAAAAAASKVKIGESAEIGWTSAEGAVFESIKVDGTVVVTEEPADHKYTFTPEEAVADHTYAVEVVYKLSGGEGEDPVYAVNVTQEGSGTVTGAGVIGAEETSREITWQAAEGWHVSKVTVDGTLLADISSGSYTLDLTEVSADINVKVVFESDEPLTPPEPAETHSVFTEYEGNGTVSDGASLQEGESYMVSWMAAEGWHVQSVAVTDADGAAVTEGLSEAEGKYAFSYETPGKDVTVKVVFEKDKAYNINAVIDAGGSITPAAAVLEKGDSCTVEWSISDAERFSIAGVTVNDEPLEESEYKHEDGSFSYIFDYDALYAANSDENLTLKVTLEEAEQPEQPTQYMVSTSLTPGAAGSISGAAMVEEGGSYTASWTVNSGYKVTKVTVARGGALEEIDAAQCLTDGAYQYEFTDIRENCSLAVVCEKEEKPVIGDATFFDIITGISGGSMDDGKTIRSVRQGDPYTVSWTPDTGNYVADVLVNGVSIGACTSYTIEEMDQDYTIEVSCKSMALDEMYYVNVTADHAATNGSRDLAVGTDHTVTWTADPGYVIESIIITKVDAAGVSVQTILEEAQIASGQYEISGAVKDDEYQVVITCKEAPAEEEPETWYDIAVTVKNAVASGETHVKAGESTTIAWTPEFGYEVRSIVIDDSVRDLSLEEFTFSNVTANHSVTVICERIGSEEPDPEAEYVISTHITDGGTITAPITVRTAEEKRSQTVTWSAPEGFRIVSVKVDNAERPSLLTAGQVTFTDITGSHSVDVTCERIVKYRITVQNDNGTIAAEPALVTEGEDSRVTWKGLDGFILESVTVDGTALSEGDYSQNADGSYSYLFQNVTADHTVVVNYIPDGGQDPGTQKYYIYTHIDNGTITPTITVADEAGRVSQTVSWNVASGYRVTEVLVDGSRVDGLGDTGTYEFANISSDHTIHVACEEIPRYQLTVDGRNVQSITPASCSVDGGSSVTVTWVPVDGMVLKSFKVDNKETALAEGELSYTFENITADHSIYVEYGPQEEPAVPDKVEISVMVTGGSKTGGGSVNYGTRSHTVTWTPNEGYAVKSVVIDGVALAQDQVNTAGGSMNFTNIVNDHSVVVVCESVGAGEDPTPAGVWVETNIINGTYDRIAVNGTEQEESLFGVYDLAKGDNFEISWKANEGYKVVSVTLDGVSRPDLLTAGKLSLVNMGSNHTLSVECRDEDTDPEEITGPFTITTSIDHGTISPSFTTTEEENAYTVTWAVDSKYQIASVLVDGNSYPFDANAAFGSVDFNPITANHTVEVRSQLKDVPEDHYVIDVIVDNSGTGKVLVGENEVESVVKGSSAKAVWEAAEGYDVTRIVIDGKSYNIYALEGCDEKTGEYYFNNIGENHKVEVYTEKHVEKEPVYYGVTVVPYGNPNGFDKLVASIPDPAQEERLLPAVLEGTEVTVWWQAAEGYRIDKVIRNNNTMSAEEMAAGMSEEGFKFSLNSDNDFVVYVSKNGPENDAFVSVTTEIDHGWVSNGASVKKGEDFEVTWRPANGYVVKSVTVTNADGTQTITEGEDFASWKHRLTEINSDTKVSIHCEEQPEEEEPTIYTYEVTTKATGGTITGGGTVLAGQDHEITWTAAENCIVESLEIYRVNWDGSSELVYSTTGETNGSYTITEIDSDYRVELVCKSENPENKYRYDVMTSITNGTINGPFLELKKTDSVTVSWTPDADCYVAQVLVDGEPVEIPADHQLVINVEAENHTVEVVCEKNEQIEIDPDNSYRIETYIYDGYGQITPTTVAAAGSNAVVEWKINSEHYIVDRVYVDGRSIEIPVSGSYTFRDVQENHKVEVYLKENLVRVEVSYEGEGDVVKSGTVFYGDNFGIVRGVPNTEAGYRLANVTVNGKLLQKGEILEDLLPDADMTLPGEEQQLARMSKLRSLASPLAARQDVSRYVDQESGLQNTFYFREITEEQQVKYVFVARDGSSDYKPYQISVDLIDGQGERDVAKQAAPDGTETIGWKLQEGYYVDWIGIVRGGGAEADISTMPEFAELIQDPDRTDWDAVKLSKIQSDIEVRVHCKSGTKPDPSEEENFSLAIKVAGPGSNDPNIRLEGAGAGLPAGTYTAAWFVGSHKVTRVKVDNEERSDLIDKTSVDIIMNKTDVLRDHEVIIYLDGKVTPILEKEAGGTGTVQVGSTIPYTISTENLADVATWENVVLTDTLPAGLKLEGGSLKLMKVTAAGEEDVTARHRITYDSATGRVTAEVGNLSKGEQFVLSFETIVGAEAVSNDIGNSVTARGTNSGMTEADEGYYVERTTDKVYPGHTVTALPADPEPHITKKVENPSKSLVTRIGDVLTYTIDVWNSAQDSVWKNVQMSDSVPDGLQVIDDSITLLEVFPNGDTAAADGSALVEFNEDSNELKVSLGDMGYDKHYRIIFRARVTEAAVNGDIGNFAIAEGFSPDGRNLVNVRTEKVYPYEYDKPENGGVKPQAAKPVIQKTAENLDHPKEQSQVGDRIRYVITVNNTQPETVWKHAVVRDRIPMGIEIDTDSIYLRSANMIQDGKRIIQLKPEVYDAESRMLSVYLGDLPYGAPYELEFTATVTGRVDEYDIGNIAWANGIDPSEPGTFDRPDEGKPGDPYDPDDDWVDEGGPTVGPVYPGEEDRTTKPGPKVTKEAYNHTHPAGRAEFGDLVQYTVTIENTQAGSAWKDVVVVDTLPEDLDPIDGSFKLIGPDENGKVQTIELDMSKVYNPETRKITVELPQSVRRGGTYWLYYSTRLVRIIRAEGSPEEVVNRVVATGKDFEGKELSVEAMNGFLYPAAAEEPETETETEEETEEEEGESEAESESESETDVPKTGDDTQIAGYFLLLIAALGVCAAELFRRKKRRQQ